MFGPVCAKVSCDFDHCPTYIYAEAPWSDTPADVAGHVLTTIINAGWSVTESGAHRCPEHASS